MIFFTEKSDFAVSQVTALEEVAPACIFTMCPSIALCCHTGELQGLFPAPGPLHTVCSLLALCFPLSL